METSVFWIIGIYQVDYLWFKSQANVCLRGVWKRVARADQGSVKGIAYFYVGNGKGVAYFLKTRQANSNSL